VIDFGLIFILIVSNDCNDPVNRLCG